MMRPATSSSSINLSAMTRKVEVDNRISLRYYYRIADSLLRQGNIYREEKNLIDLYVILLRYSSLVSETIPYHRDYQTSCQKEKAYFKRKLLAVLDELEDLKPQVRSQLDMLGKVNLTSQITQLDSTNKILSVGSLNNKVSSSQNYKLLPSYTAPLPLPAPKQSNEYIRAAPSNLIGSQLQKLSLGLPLPKQETLSRHSFLGPNGLHGRWLGPSAQIKVQYPTNIVVDPDDFSSLNQDGQDEPVAMKDNDSTLDQSTMDSILSLDDGKWLSENANIPKGNDAGSKDLQVDIIRQPSPPPVLAQVEPQTFPISSLGVGDTRSELPNHSQNGLASTNTIHDLHVPVKMLEEFLRVARGNTRKNLETCGVLAGSLQNRMFQITTLIIPKQESTSDTTVNEEEIFDYQDKRSLFPLGWIHTHPTQTCFMSSVDLHTHYSYQVMLPEAIAIVMAPTDTKRPHGIFHLSDPGVGVIRKCPLRGFHSHQEPDDGGPIYEHCAHVYMNSKLKFDVVDLR